VPVTASEKWRESRGIHTVFTGAIGRQTQHSVNAVKVVEADLVVAVAPYLDATRSHNVLEVDLGIPRCSGLIIVSNYTQDGGYMIELTLDE
jgi:hypothetical protein